MSTLSVVDSLSKWVYKIAWRQYSHGASRCFHCAQRYYIEKMHVKRALSMAYNSWYIERGLVSFTTMATNLFYKNQELQEEMFKVCAKWPRDGSGYL